MNYVQEIRVLLSDIACLQYEEKLKEFVCNIREDDIVCQMEWYGTGNISNAKNVEGILWITDSAKAAGELIRQGCAVLGWLHENNRQDNFAVCRYACEDLQGIDAIYLERVYRRCRGLPWDILLTARCLIRETTVADVEDFYKIYKEPSITEFLDALYGNPEEERAYAQDYIDQVYSFYDFGIWTVVERGTCEVIGRAGICYREGYEDPELGFVIGVPWQGKGYATEVCREILRYANEELGFERIFAFVQPSNRASMRVCDKLGMKDSGEVVVDGRRYVKRTKKF